MADSPDASKRGEPEPPAVVPADLRRRHSSLVVLLPIALGMLIVVAFRAALNNEFVNWGDEDAILHNDHCGDLGRSSLAWMFTTFHMGRYQPLSWLAIVVVREFGPLEPFVFHVASLTLHIVNAVLVYALARNLLARTIPGAFPSGRTIAIGATAAAAFFAVHPLRVESVAWAAAMGSLLSATFWLVAVLAYLRAQNARQNGSIARPWLALSLIGMLLSVLAGNNAATSVAIVLLLDVYPLRRLGGGSGRWFGPVARPVWREKAPFLALAITTAVVAGLANAHLPTMQGLPDRSLMQRLADFLFNLSLGLWKTLWPQDLAPLYVFSARAAATAVGVVATIGILAWLLRCRWTAPWAAWVCYVFLLLPLPGVFSRDGQTPADRHTYLACIGWAMVFGGAVTWCLQIAAEKRRRAVTAGVAVVASTVVGGLSTLTWRQCQVWNTSASLWAHVLAREPDCLMARMHLGEELLRRGEPSLAADELRHAARLCPGNARIQCDLGLALYESGALGEASAALRRAIELDPNNNVAHLGLGCVLGDQKQFDAAMEQFRTAQRLNPDGFRVYLEMGKVLRKQGRFDAAAAAYQEGIQHWPGAATLYSLAGTALMDARQYAAARKTLEAGLKVADDPAELANNLAWLLATCEDAAIRDGAEAVRLAELADRAAWGDDPGFTDTLAAAYAEAGRFDDAIRTQQRAIELARFNRPEVIPEFRQRLALFEKHQPYREPPKKPENPEPQKK